MECERDVVLNPGHCLDSVLEKVAEDYSTQLFGHKIKEEVLAINRYFYLRETMIA